jgi:hypothetical protein
MIRVEITAAELRRFDRAMDRYRRVMGVASEDAMKDLAATGAVKLAQVTEPRGLSAAVGKKFAANLVPQVLKAIRKGNVEGRPGTAKQVHDSYRRNGRVAFPGKAPRGQFKRAPVPLDEVEELVRKRQRAAGIAKAGWIAAARNLGRKVQKLPKWIESNVAAAKGAATTTRSAFRGATVELTNGVRYASNVISDDKIEEAKRMAILARTRAMNITVQKHLEALE